MRARGQFLVAVLVLAVVAAGGVFLQRVVGVRAAGAAAPGTAPSGAWFCPHGGGPSGWEVSLSVANPGPDPVRIRVRDLGAKKPVAPKSYSVNPGSEIQVPTAADGRERATVVEYFGGWVGVGWVAHAGGGETGVAAEPCLPRAGRTWFLPDGTTETKDQDAYLVVMNPFAADAVLSVTLFTEGRPPIHTEDWSNYLLPASRSTAFHLNTKALGERTVSAEIDVSAGRVAAASLGISAEGGIRSAVGYLGTPPRRVILPGGGDQGRTDLVVMDPAAQKAGIGGTIEGSQGQQAVGGLQDAALGGGSAQTYSVPTEGASTIDMHASPGEAGFVAVRRTYGVSSDQGATAGAILPGAAWIVLPAVAGEPAHPGLYLSNPGPEPASVAVSFLPLQGGVPAQGTMVSVPPGRTVPVPRDLLEGRPLDAVMAVAIQGTFVPVTASYSLGREGVATYAVALGVTIPPKWVPT